MYDSTAVAESLFEHLAAELGPDIATGFQPHATFTSPFKKRLLAAIDAAHNDCETALDALTTERESLKRAASEPRGILTDLTRHSGDQQMMTDDGEAEAVETLGERVEAVIARRQEHLQTHSIPRRLDSHDICEYLYGDQSWTYPVLHTADYRGDGYRRSNGPGS